MTTFTVNSSDTVELGLESLMVGQLYNESRPALIVLLTGGTNRNLHALEEQQGGTL